MSENIEKWILAQKKFGLSNKHIQMARELSFNPDKFGKLNNHVQQPWKAPLPQFIEKIYFKHFKREFPVTIKSLAEIMSDEKKKQPGKKLEKIERRSQQNKTSAAVSMPPGSSDNDNTEMR